MPINPNELAKIISEMSKTLQEMSETHLKTVESILSEQIDLNKKTTQEHELQEQRDALIAANAKKQEADKDAIEQKAISYQKDVSKLLLSNLVDSTSSFKKYASSGFKKLGLSDTIDKIQTARRVINAPVEFLKSAVKKKGPKESSTVSVKKDLLVKNSNFDHVTLSSKGSVFINSNKLNYKTENMDEEDFTRHDIEDPQKIELSLLKAIDAKLAKLKLGGSDGLFDVLSKTIPQLVTLVTTAGEAGAVGATGVAGVGIASKLSKWFPSLSKIGKVGAKAESVVSKVKNPKVAAGLLAGTAVLGGIGYAVSGDDEDNEDASKEPPKTIKGKYLGGSVDEGTPYLVGEKGQELFMPDTDGVIIPNNKLNENTFGSKKTLLTAFRTIVDAVNKKFKTVKDMVVEAWQKLKDYASGLYDNAKDYVKDAGETILNAPSTAINYVKNLITGNNQSDQKKSTPVGTQSTATKTLSAPAPAPGPTNTNNQDDTNGLSTGTLPQYYGGKYEIPDTSLYKVHDNEMVIPAQQAEMVRSAAELNSNYSMPPVVPTAAKKNKLSETFWINKFVPAFAEAIKVDKARDNKRNNFVADAFGI